MEVIEKRNSQSLLLSFSQGKKLEEIISNSRSIKIQDCLSAPIVRIYPDEFKPKVVGVVVFEIERYVKWLNLPEYKQPSVDQMKIWAETFVEKFDTESLEDYIYFFRQVRTGNIKINFYERLGCDVILEAFSNYLSTIKIPKREQVLHNKKVEHRKQTEKALEVKSNALQEIYKKIAYNQPQKSAKESTVKWSSSSTGQKHEIASLKLSLHDMPIGTLKALEKQYLMQTITEKRNGKFIPIRSVGCKMIQSRLTLLASKKAIKWALDNDKI